jgi:hypothetical protein
MPRPSETLDRVRTLAGSGQVRASDHGYDELADDALFADEVLTGLAGAIVVEDIRQLFGDLLSSFCNTIAKTGRFTSCGEYLRAKSDLVF